MLGTVLSLFLSAPASAAMAPAVDWNRFSVLTPAGPEEPPAEMFRRVKRLLYAEHKVAAGERSVRDLAKAYGSPGIKIEDMITGLQSTNNREMLELYSGMKVIVHNKDGLLYEVKKASETLNRIVARYHREPRAAMKFKESIVAINRLPGIALADDYEFLKGSRVLLPKVPVSFDTYRFPFMTTGWPRISSRFGSRYHPILKRRKVHEGLDLPQPHGTPVVPSRRGQVIQAGWHEGYGMLVIIRHSDGATTRYGHLSKIMVKVGQLVQRGRTVIGRVGSTGLSSGPHLHFEVRDKTGKAVNPGAKIGRR